MRLDFHKLRPLVGMKSVTVGGRQTRAAFLRAIDMRLSAIQLGRCLPPCGTSIVSTFRLLKDPIQRTQ